MAESRKPYSGPGGALRKGILRVSGAVGCPRAAEMIGVGAAFRGRRKYPAVFELEKL